MVVACASDVPIADTEDVPSMEAVDSRRAVPRQVTNEVPEIEDALTATDSPTPVIEEVPSMLAEL